MTTKNFLIFLIYISSFFMYNVLYSQGYINKTTHLFFNSNGTGMRRENDSIIRYSINDDTILIVNYSDHQNKFLILNLHENERTSIMVARDVIDKYGGRFIYLSHKGERNISFVLGNKVYTFDPNRIFTREGIKKNLSNLGDYSFEAEEAVNKFAEFLLKELTKDSVVIIAVHNNSDGSYSAKSYLGSYKQDAKEVFLNNKEDEDDFFFVTRYEDFLFLKSEGYNVILQDNEKVHDDGSLSVYCGKNNIPYINIESQQGKYQKQLQMIRDVIEYLKRN